MEGRGRSKWKRRGSKWRPGGGSVGQWSQICITLMRSRIRIRNRIEGQHLSKKDPDRVKVMRIRNTGFIFLNTKPQRCLNARIKTTSTFLRNIDQKVWFKLNFVSNSGVSFKRRNQIYLIKLQFGVQKWRIRSSIWTRIEQFWPQRCAQQGRELTTRSRAPACRKRLYTEVPGIKSRPCNNILSGSVVDPGCLSRIPDPHPPQRF